MFTIYFAGDLFNHKDLMGNALLAAAIEQVSGGRYQCVLPQNVEATTERGVDIRNKDLKLIMECDLGIFNFDGLELDSGTVAEYMFAKSLDIPAILLRTDFRSSGDQMDSGDDWNLMCSFYPRTKVVRLNGLAAYRNVLETDAPMMELLSSYYTEIATTLIANLDAVRHDPPLLQSDRDQLEARYQWAIQYAGGGLAELCAEPDFVPTLVARKIAKGVA